MPVHPELLEMVRCPRCRGTLVQREAPPAEDALVCGACRVAYPVIGGIPLLLEDEARPLEQDG